MARIATLTRFALVFAPLGCALACASVPRPRLPPRDDAALAATDDKSEKGAAAGRILLEETELRFERDENTGAPVVRVVYHRLARIGGSRGQWLRSIGAPYDATFTVVDDIFAQVRTPDGTEKSWERKDAVDAPTMPGFVLYSDDRGLLLSPPQQPAGSVVDVFAATTTKSPHLFVFGHDFGGTVPVALSRFTVTAPPGWEVEIDSELMNAPKLIPPTSTSTDADGRTVRVWERKNEPARAAIRRGLGASAQGARVLVRLKSWTDPDGRAMHAPADDKALSAEEFALAHASATATPALRATVNELLRDVPVDDEAARAAKLYAWVRDRVRYCAIEIGMGGFVPHPAGDVHQARYGDCKDKATLLHTMLGVAGIASRTVLIDAGDWPRRFRMPALGGNFNHMILVVDLKSGPVFADPTSRTAAFGELPEADEDRVLLPVSERGSSLLQAPASSPARDVIDDAYDLTLSHDGDARGVFSSTMSGAPAEEMRTALLMNPPKDRAEVVQHAILIWEPRVKKLMVKGEAPSPLPSPVVTSGDVTLHLFRGGVVGDGVLRASYFYARAFPDVDPKHVGPLLLGGRLTQHSALKVKLPPGAAPGAPPPPTDVENAVGAFHEAWSIAADGAVTLDRTVVIKERVLEGGAVDDLRALFTAAAAGDAQPFVISFASPAGGAQ